jgi:hypothetical protein
MVEHTGGSLTQTVELKNGLPKGVYHLEVRGNNQTFTQQLIKN